MTIRTTVTCYRLFTNAKGFKDWEREPKYDGTFDDDDTALCHMDEVTNRREVAGGIYVFRVESYEVDERMKDSCATTAPTSIRKS